MNRWQLVLLLLAVSSVVVLAGCTSPDGAVEEPQTTSLSPPTTTTTPVSEPTTALQEPVTVREYRLTLIGNATDKPEIVEVTNQSVTVQGTITAPTPCHSLTVAEMPTTAQSGTMVEVTIQTKSGGGACTQTLDAKSYELTLNYEGSLQGIQIQHDGAENETVTLTVNTSG